jgi:hypothetical protein
MERRRIVMRDGEKLNEAQQRHLYTTCQYIDGLLSDVEQTFQEPDSLSAFPRYVMDMTSEEMSEFRDHIHRIREELLRTLAWQEMQPEPPSIPATRAVQRSLSFIDIAIEELNPSYMRGCGAVPEGAVEGLHGVIRGLRSATRGMEQHLREQMAARAGEKTKG